MNLIRNGVYAEYKDHQLKLVESRVELPVPVDERSYQIWYEGLNCPFEDFIKSDHNSGFYKSVKIDQLKNVLAVRTLGKYNKFIVEVFSSKSENCLEIATRNKSNATKLEFIEVGQNWFMKEVRSSELEIMWEDIIQIKYSNDEYGHVTQLNNLVEMKMEQLRQDL